MKDLLSVPPIRFVKVDVAGKQRPRLKLLMAAEEMRCIVKCIADTLSLHGMVPKYSEIVFELTDQPVQHEGKAVSGLAFMWKGTARVWVDGTVNNFVCTALHEYLHLCGLIDEWVVSTLTAKLKSQIIERSALLLASYYKNAAFIAHRLIAYKKGDMSKYNKEQWLVHRVKEWDYKHRK